MACFKASGDQFFPDFRQLAQGGAKQVDPLATGDLGVEVVFLGHFTQHDQFVRRYFAARYPWHDGIGAVFLHVGHEGIVGVLQRHVIGGHDVFVPASGQNRPHGRFADIAPVPFAVLLYQAVEGADAVHFDQVE